MRIRWIHGLSIDGKAVPAYVASLLNKPIKEFDTGIRLLTGKECVVADAEFKKTLGDLVNQWIDSGKANQDGDVPSERSIVWHSATYTTLIAETLVKFWKRNSPRIIVELDGTLILEVRPNSESSEGVQHSVFIARELAVFEFARLLDSTSPERLSRCDACLKFFAREKAPKRGAPIYHGTFCCKKCASIGRARQIVERRELQKNKKIEWAVDALERWKPEKRFGDKADWIVKNVNAKLPAGQTPIKVNWVTRHLTEIEAEVERRKHAES
jgi:hypothetical protein